MLYLTKKERVRDINMLLFSDIENKEKAAKYDFKISFLYLKEGKIDFLNYNLF